MTISDNFFNFFTFELSIAFSNFPHLKDERLAVIELLLQRTTDNDPKRRLSVGNFRKALETWMGHTNDSHYLQHYEWYLLMSHIEKDAYVGIRFIFDLQQIIDVFNNFNWKSYLNCIAMRKIQQFHIIDILTKAIPEIK